MYYYGGGNCGCGQYTQMPYYSCGDNHSSYAIVLVLFILLVIVLGTRWNNN